MKTKEERKERRGAIIGRIKSVIADRARHIVRAPDAEDIEAAQALGLALITLAPGGYTAEEWALIEDLFAALKEERADT
jgi:hypothetical protein